MAKYRRTVVSRTPANNAMQPAGLAPHRVNDDPSRPSSGAGAIAEALARRPRPEMVPAPELRCGTAPPKSILSTTPGRLTASCWATESGAG